MPIALIPARTGSTGIPGKNFTDLAGDTPLHRAVTCCVAAGLVPWVSSNESPIDQWMFWLQRPASLAMDSTPMAAVVEHFLRAVDGPPDEIILLVQPTQPLRQPSHLRAAVDLMEHYPSVASVVLTEPAEKLYRVTAGGYLIPVIGSGLERRQDAPLCYRCDGTVYAFRRHAFLTYPSFRNASTYALIIPPSETAPLDTPLDWQLAELRLKVQHDQTTSPDPASLAYP